MDNKKEDINKFDTKSENLNLNFRSSINNNDTKSV